MKNKGRKILFISLLILLIIPLVFCLFSEKPYHTIQRIKVSFSAKQSNTMISEEDVLYKIYLTKKLEKGQKIEVHDQDLKQIKDTLLSHPHIKDAHIIANLNGTLQIEVEQVLPILSIILSNGTQYILTQDSNLVPFPKEYFQKVPVATGNINKNVISKLYTLGSYVQEKPFWNASLEQIFVNKKGDIQLITKLGSFEILLGDTKNLNDKLNRSKIFIKEVLSTKGWDAYKAVDLRYKKQIIAY